MEEEYVPYPNKLYRIVGKDTKLNAEVTNFAFAENEEAVRNLFRTNKYLNFDADALIITEIGK